MQATVQTLPYQVVPAPLARRGLLAFTSVQYGDFVHRNYFPASALIALLLAAAACATAGGPKSGNSTADRITAAEIVGSNATSAYDLVSQLRPGWLRPPNLTMSGATVRVPVVLVYVDGVRLGGINELRTLPLSAVRSLEYLNATRAAGVVGNVGSEPVGAAIMVSTKR